MKKEKYEFQTVSTEGLTNKQVYFNIIEELVNCLKTKFSNSVNALQNIKLHGDNKIEILQKLTYIINLFIDTEDAILEYYKNGLFINKNIGEYSLRLYGILNATSLHFEGIIELEKILNGGRFEDIRSTSRIYKLRNKLGSHTLDYVPTDGEKPKSYMSRYALSLCFRWGDHMILTSFDNTFEEVNLIELMTEFNEITENKISSLSDKLIKTIFPGGSRGINEICDIHRSLADRSSYDYQKLQIK